MIRSDKPAFRWKLGKSGKTVIEVLALGKYFKQVLPYQACYSEKYRYSEFVMLFFDCIETLNLPGYKFTNPDILMLPSGKREGDLFNELIELIRKESKSSKFRHKVSQRAINADKNYLSGKNYIAALFNNHEKLMVIRIDPGYKAEFAASVTIEEAQAHMKKFLNNWRSNKMFDVCVGYIWKLEQGAEKGFHFHMFLFFNGNVLQKDEYIARKICNYWIETITDNRGHCTDSNRRKKDFDRCCVGEINYTDHQKREYLLKNLEYVTKKEQFVKLKTLLKTRVFGRGEMPRSSGLGRPRTKNVGVLALV